MLLAILSEELCKACHTWQAPIVDEQVTAPCKWTFNLVPKGAANHASIPIAHQFNFRRSS